MRLATVLDGSTGSTTDKYIKLDKKLWAKFSLIISYYLNVPLKVLSVFNFRSIEILHENSGRPVYLKNVYS